MADEEIRELEILDEIYKARANLWAVLKTLEGRPIKTLTVNTIDLFCVLAHLESSLGPTEG